MERLKQIMNLKNGGSLLKILAAMIFLLLIVIFLNPVVGIQMTLGLFILTPFVLPFVLVFFVRPPISHDIFDRTDSKLGWDTKKFRIGWGIGLSVIGNAFWIWLLSIFGGILSLAGYLWGWCAVAILLWAEWFWFAHKGYAKIKDKEERFGFVVSSFFVWAILLTVYLFFHFLFVT